MPRILITTDRRDGQPPTVLLEEGVLPTQLETDPFSAQLVERVGWAVRDAQEAEQDFSRR